jgi:magnesium transporter
MAFLSELLGRKVTDMDGNPIGKLDDLVARDKPDFPHPSIDGLVIKAHRNLYIVPFTEVVSLLAPTIILRHSADQLPIYALTEDDVLLARDVLDKQIIDTDGARVVRVNDLELVRIHNIFYVSNVDAGLMGILRRLGLANPTLSLAAVFRLKALPSAIPWHSVELLHHDCTPPMWPRSSVISTGWRAARCWKRWLWSSWLIPWRKWKPNFRPAW